MRIVLCGSTNRILVLTKNNRILLYAPQRNEPTADSSLLPFQYHDDTVPSPFFDQHFDPLYSESINLM